MLTELLQVINGAYGFTSPNLTAFTVVMGKAQAVQNHAVEVSYPANSLQLRLLTSGGGQQSTQVPNSPVIKKENLLAFMEYMSWCTTATTYTNIVLNQTWRQFYGFKLRPVVYDDGQGGHVIKNELAVPCRDCSMIVRENLITVDHQRPQAGNDIEPICKVFRAVGLTRAGPGGEKGKAVGSGMAAKIGGTVSATGSRDDRYSLNAAGTIYLSLVNAVGGIGALKVACLNHFVNLQPLCHACNSPTRNTAYYP